MGGAKKGGASCRGVFARLMSLTRGNAAARRGGSLLQKKKGGKGMGEKRAARAWAGEGRGRGGGVTACF